MNEETRKIVVALRASFGDTLVLKAAGLLETKDKIIESLLCDFTDYVTSGMPDKRAPYCASCNPSCIDSRGYCINNMCNGFVPKVRDSDE